MPEQNRKLAAMAVLSFVVMVSGCKIHLLGDGDDDDDFDFHNPADNQVDQDDMSKEERERLPR